MQRKQQVPLQEIGRAAGVSAPTVSRVLNRHPGVSGEVRSRVMEAIEALGYDAEPILRKAAVISNAQMHERRIEIVMFPLPEQNDIFKLSYFNEIYEGCLSVLNQSGTARASLLTWERSWRGTADLPETVLKRFRKADGLLLIGSSFPQAVRELKRLNKAIVAIGMGTASDSLDYVSHNDFQAGQVLADYLIDRGCVEIGFFSGSRHSECFTARLNGVMVQALHRLGEKSFSCRYADSTDNKDVMETLAAWLDSGKCPRTLVFSHFVAAYVFYNLLVHRGLKPDRYNIATFDAESDFIPGMEFTSMETFPRQLGFKAAGRVLQLIARPPEAEMPQSILVPCRLKPGNTVRAVPEKRETTGNIS